MDVLIFSYSTLFTVDTSLLVPIISLNDLKMKYTKGMRSVIHSNVKLMFHTCKLNMLVQILKKPYICIIEWHIFKCSFCYHIENNFVGSEWGQFVSSATGKNIVYNFNIDVSKLSKADKIKWQNAMRASWWINNLKFDQMNAQR